MNINFIIDMLFENKFFITKKKLKLKNINLKIYCKIKLILQYIFKIHSKINFFRSKKTPKSYIKNNLNLNYLDSNTKKMKILFFQKKMMRISFCKLFFLIFLIKKLKDLTQIALFIDLCLVGYIFIKKQIFIDSPKILFFYSFSKSIMGSGKFLIFKNSFELNTMILHWKKLNLQKNNLSFSRYLEENIKKEFRFELKNISMNSLIILNPYLNKYQLLIINKKHKKKNLIKRWLVLKTNLIRFFNINHKDLIKQQLKYKFKHLLTMRWQKHLLLKSAYKNTYLLSLKIKKYWIQYLVNRILVYTLKKSISKREIIINKWNSLCMETGRKRTVLKIFKNTRMHIKHMFNKNGIIGLQKASW